MTPGGDELLEALARATGGTPSWERMMFVKNVGPIPTLSEDPGDSLEARGFQLLLLDGNGGIGHFVKCRAAADPRGAREAWVYDQLRRGPAAPSVPRTAVAVGQTLRVIVTEAIQGESYAARLDRRTLEERLGDAATVLETMRGIRAALPASDAPATFDAAAALEGSLATLAKAGFPAGAIQTLRAAAAGTVPWRSQHGDLWLANILWNAHGPVLFDFEAYGEIGHPMFDAWHLARSIYRYRGKGPGWLRILNPALPLDRAWNELLRAEQHRSGGGDEDLRPGLVWYIVTMAATLLERGIPERFSRPFLNDARRVARLSRPRRLA